MAFGGVVEEGWVPGVKNNGRYEILCHFQVQHDLENLKTKYTLDGLSVETVHSHTWVGQGNVGYGLTGIIDHPNQSLNIGPTNIRQEFRFGSQSVEVKIPPSGQPPAVEFTWHVVAGGINEDWRDPMNKFICQPVNLESYYCTPPSNISVVPFEGQGLNNYVKPQAKVKVSWAQGQGGQNNPITEYYIYCGDTMVGTTDGWANSIEVTLPKGLTRGRSYQFSVEAHSRLNDASANGPSVTINKLPDPPIIKNKGTVITNKELKDLGENGITVDLTPGKIYNNNIGRVDSDTGIGITNYYLSPDKYKKYEFRTSDGLEYSKPSFVIVSPKPAMKTEYTAISPNNEFYLYPTNSTKYPKARGISFSGKVNDLGEGVKYSSTGKIYYGDTPNTLNKTMQVTPDYKNTPNPAINIIALGSVLTGKFYKAELTCVVTSAGTPATLTSTGPICYCPKPTGIKSHKIVGDLGGTYADKAMNNKYLDVTIEPTLDQDTTDTEYASLKYWKVEAIASDGLVSGQTLAQIDSVQPSYRISKAEIEQGDRVGTIRYGEEYRVRITLYDGAYEYVINDKATRVEAPQWGEGNFNTLNLFIDGNNKPYSRYYVAPRTKNDAGLTFTFPKIRDGKWEELQYKLFFYLDKEEQGTYFADFTPDDSSAMQNFHISADFWKNYLINYPKLGAGDPLKPLLYDLPFRITIRVVSRFEGAEIWSEEMDLTPKNSYLKIKEKPYFPEGNIKLAGRHSWSKEYLDTNYLGESLPLESVLPQNYDYVGQQIDGENSILVNPDEYLTFKFTAARDYNYNDVQYRLKANGIRVGEEHLTTIEDTIGGKKLLTYTLLNDESLRQTVGEDIPVIFTIEAFDADEATLGATSIILDNVIYLTHTGKPDFGIPSLLPGRGIPQGESNEIVGAKLGQWVLKYWGGSSLPNKLQNLNRPNLTLQEKSGDVINYQPRNFLNYKVKDKETSAILVNKEIELDPDILKANKEQILYLDPKGVDNSKELLVEFTLKVSTGFGAGPTLAAARDFKDKLKYEFSQPITVGYIPRIPLIYPRPRQIGINGLPQPEDVVTIRTISSLSDTSWVTFRNTRGEITLRLNADSGEIQLSTIDCGTY